MKIMVTAAATLAALMTITAVDHADARERRARAEVQTQRGTAVGEAVTRREPGSRSRTGTWTGANGKSTTVTDDRAWDRKAGTYSHDRARTFPDGSTRSVDADATRTAPGQYEATRTVTGRNGETRTQTGEFATTKTDDGRLTTGTIQTEKRGEIEYSKDVSRGDGGRSVQSSATFEDGTSIKRDTSTACAQGAGCTTTGAITGRDGGMTTFTETRQKTADGYAKSRDTTFKDGSTRAVDVNATKTGDGTASATRTVTGRDGETRTQTGTVAVTRTP